MKTKSTHLDEAFQTIVKNTRQGLITRPVNITLQLPDWMALVVVAHDRKQPVEDVLSSYIRNQTMEHVMQDSDDVINGSGKAKS